MSTNTENEPEETLEDNPLTPLEEEAMAAGNAAYMAHAFNDVVKFAEIGIMAGAKDIEDEEDRKLYINRGASACFVFKQLIAVFEEEIERFAEKTKEAMDSSKEKPSKEKPSEE